MPPEKERTHFREKVNHWFSPLKWLYCDQTRQVWLISTDETAIIVRTAAFPSVAGGKKSVVNLHLSVVHLHLRCGLSFAGGVTSSRVIQRRWVGLKDVSPSSPIDSCWLPKQLLSPRFGPKVWYGWHSNTSFFFRFLGTACVHNSFSKGIISWPRKWCQSLVFWRLVEALKKTIYVVFSSISPPNNTCSLHHNLPVFSGSGPALSGRVWLACPPWHPDAVCSQTPASPLSFPD